MATISFNKMEKPSKFEVRSLASLSVSQRITDRSSAASVVLSEAVPPISKQTRLLDERSLCGSPSKGSVRHVVPDKLSSDRFYDPRAVTILPSGGKQPLQQLEVEQETVVSAMSSDSGNDRKERAIITKKSSIIQTAPVEVKRVFESVAMRDRAKMKATAAVFKRMGMGRHIRSGDFNDTTQRTPVLIPLHKVLAVDPPELEMISYAAVKDVYHQKTKYANKVTGFSREKFVPLFARTTLVEKNGVTPGTFTALHTTIAFRLKRCHHTVLLYCRR